MVMSRWIEVLVLARLRCEVAHRHRLGAVRGNLTRTLRLRVMYIRVEDGLLRLAEVVW